MAERVLLLSYAFPPIALPEAYLAAKTMASLPDLTVDVIAAEAFRPGFGHDEGLLPYVARGFGRVRRLAPPPWLRGTILDRIPCIGDAPDALRFLAGRAEAAAERMEVGTTAAMVTWSQWHSVHLAGLALKRRHPRLPWLAHLSDPWVDNPFARWTAPARAVNRRLEARVVEAADRLIFTSAETVDLVMAKYPPGFRRKCAVVPHPYDESLYPTATPTESGPLVLRYLGAFYGARKPEPLFRALARLLADGRIAPGAIRVELIGSIPDRMARTDAALALPAGLVTVRPSVGYLDSLALMKSADLLLVIDAPAALSVFLPSKLIDYVGAGRPILGLTPPGASAKLIRELGGWVADPANDDAAADALAQAIGSGRAGARPWGRAEIRARYAQPKVATLQAALIREAKTA
ncbi:MAG: glycosyltransferase family 4 protein [Alphaproteobacteria bacterium]|nr:glycosyltransferase family 4 protein [Alphaproteobacteria bacterium]